MDRSCARRPLGRRQKPVPAGLGKIALAAVLAAGVIGAAGCGSSSDDDAGKTATSGSSSSSTTTAKSSGTAGVMTLDQLYAGTEHAPPSTSPPAAKGKSIWWISCGQSVPQCARPAAAAGKAAAALGVDFHIADANLNQGGGNEKAIRQAVAAGASGMVIQGSIGCLASYQALKEAKAKGIKLIGIQSIDCSDPPTNQTSVYSDKTLYAKASPTAADWWQAHGVFGASYLIDKVGDAKAIAVTGSVDPIYVNVTKGFEDTMAKCSGCKVTQKVAYAPQDLAPGGSLPAQIRSAVLKASPDTNSAYMAFDIAINAFGGQKALKESGRKVTRVGGGGSAEISDLIRSGQWDAAVGSDGDWAGWAAIDTINRVLNDKPTVPEGWGFRLIDKDHNLPAEGKDYASPIDYKAAYKAAWAKANQG